MEFEHQNASLITAGTTQTFPNPSQTQGFEPAEGNISINGSSENSLNYVSIYNYFYYDGIQIFLEIIHLLILKDLIILQMGTYQRMSYCHTII